MPHASLAYRLPDVAAWLTRRQLIVVLATGEFQALAAVVLEEHHRRTGKPSLWLAHA